MMPMIMSLLKHIARFNAEDAIRIAQELYGLCAVASALPSERDRNFLLQTESGERFVLKIANAMERRAMLEAHQPLRRKTVRDAARTFDRLLLRQFGERSQRAGAADFLVATMDQILAEDFGT